MADEWLDAVEERARGIISRYCSPLLVCEVLKDCGSRFESAAVLRLIADYLPHTVTFERGEDILAEDILEFIVDCCKGQIAISHDFLTFTFHCSDEADAIMIKMRFS